MDNIKAHAIVIEPIDKLVLNPDNPNKHPPEQIEHLRKIIKYQGFRNPVIVSNRSGFLIAGHGRIEAAKLEGFTTVPVIYQDFENEASEYAHMVADNAIQMRSELDKSMINEKFVEFGPDFDADFLGIKNFVIEPFDSGFNPSEAAADKKHKVCPHCGEAL
jgi:hypothetical protein